MMSVSVPVSGVFSALILRQSRKGCRHEHVEQTNVIPKSAKQVGPVFREKSQWLEGEMPIGQEESQGVIEPRGGVEEEPPPLEDRGWPVSGRGQATAARVGRGKKQPPVEVVPPPAVPPEFGAALPRHHYAPGVMDLFIRGLLVARAGQRCLAAVLDLVAPWLPGIPAVPCANTGRMWLLRVGLHELTRPKPKADDWVWIFDHTVQLGGMKALIIVGIRLSQWEEQRGPLRHEDLTVLDVMPMRHSSGPAVEARLKAVAQQTGDPRAIVGDGGTDLKCGIASFQQTHHGVARLYDIKHKMALLLQQQLEKDSRWAKFIARVNQTRARVLLTDLAFLTPANLKAKSRYLNLPPLVTWGRNTLRFLDHPRDLPGKPVDRKVLEEKLGWLREYREALYHWSVLLAIVETAERYVRHEGYHAAAAQQLQERLDGLGINPATQAMERATLEFVAEQSAQARPQERLIGSSEVLESLIGKYKHLQGTHNQGGMTPQLLAFGAIVMKKTTETIGNALSAVRTRDVLQWCQQHLGLSMQAQRRYAHQEQKPDTKLLLATPSF
jgi:hypothetical protein